MADIATVLFKYHLKFVSDPNWIDRDRFVVKWTWINASIFMFISAWLQRYYTENIKNFNN